ncbi:MAG TPA: GNAT family N-acetyltransferase [Burkholderiales bacterium]|nr:GNAT family N-acetyltransferase [Burkholderiales bacterium]
MTLDATIVPLADAHIEGFRAAVDSVARERRYVAMLQAPPLEDCRAYVLDMRRRGFPQYVALCDERVAGWCDLSPVNRPVHAHCGTLGIGVIADYRGRGLGSRLLAATLERGRKIGLTRIELEVRAANLPAIALYERFGFVREGVKKNSVRIDGEYEDVIAMALLF